MSHGARQQTRRAAQEGPCSGAAGKSKAASFKYRAHPYRSARPGAHGRRLRQERDRAPRHRRRPRDHAQGDARSGARRQCPKGRRAGRRAPCRHHGGQAHARADPALPSAADHQGRNRHRSRARAARLPGARDGESDRPDRRRDGGADGGVDRVPDHLRHGQGGRARHAHRGHSAAAKERRQIRRLPRGGLKPWR